MLDIRNLSTAYTQDGRSVTAIRGVNIFVRQGSSTAVVGESGSGKSTVAMSVMGMIRPPVGRIVDGEILVDDQDVTKKSPSEMRRLLKTDIGFVPQDPTTALDPLYTVRSQIAESMSVVSRRDQEQVIVELLASLGITNPQRRIRDYPHQFSGGMRQRVAIAIALAKNPRLLIADEPTTALDVTTQLGILKLLDRLRIERNLATLFITHNVRAARLICQDLVVMYAGVVVESGPLEVVFREPSHPYTRALLELAAPTNAARQRLKAIPGSPPSLKDMPAGCPFVGRCPNATAICRSEMPATTAQTDGRSFACWNPVTR